MVTNFFVLQGLAQEWDSVLRSARFVEAYSHLPSEATLVFEQADGDRRAIRVSVRPGAAFVYSQIDPRRPRSNVTGLFESAGGRRIDGIGITDRDRILRIRLDDGSRFEIHPYGSRPNVFLVSDDAIVEAFKRSDDLEGQHPPDPRLPDCPRSRRELEAGLETTEGDLARRLRKLVPQLGADLAKEVVFRDETDLWSGLEQAHAALAAPDPVAYAVDQTVLFSPIALRHLGSEPIEQFSSVDAGVRWTVKRRGRIRRLESVKKPLVSALAKSEARWSRRVSELESAGQSESRADRYEAWGHLLMAHPHAAGSGSNEVTVPDILSDGSPTTIPLDPERTIIQNAERYYGKARRIREERTYLADRLNEALRSHATAATLLEAFSAAESPKDVDRLKKAHAEELRRFVGGKTPDVESTPFKRIKVAAGYEVWVGRNAKENDLLTFDYAARHDLWMHARGVSGSHVVLRLPGRDQEVDRRTKETAASVAAWFSRARGSGLVPVQIARRKHVTKPRGAPPGVVRVQNEEVVLVEPKLP